MRPPTTSIGPATLLSGAGPPGEGTVPACVTGRRDGPVSLLQSRGTTDRVGAAPAPPQAVPRALACSRDAASSSHSSAGSWSGHLLSGRRFAGGRAAKAAVDQRHLSSRAGGRATRGTGPRSACSSTAGPAPTAAHVAAGRCTALGGWRSGHMHVPAPEQDVELGSHTGGRDRFGQLCALCHIHVPEQAGAAGSCECSPMSSLCSAHTGITYRRPHHSSYICSPIGEAPKPALLLQTPLTPLARDTVLRVEPKNTGEGLL